jgi:hypothetical protein
MTMEIQQVKAATHGPILAQKMRNHRPDMLVTEMVLVLSTIIYGDVWVTWFSQKIMELWKEADDLDVGNLSLSFKRLFRRKARSFYGCFATKSLCFDWWKSGNLQDFHPALNMDPLDLMV